MFEKPTTPSETIPKQPKQKYIKKGIVPTTTSITRPKSSNKMYKSNTNNKNNYQTAQSAVSMRNQHKSVNKIKKDENIYGGSNNNNNYNSEYSSSKQAKDIKVYQNEINNLRATITKLKNENQKLKIALQKERSQNEKYRQLTEEIIRHYEKTKKSNNK